MTTRREPLQQPLPAPSHHQPHPLLALPIKYSMDVTLYPFFRA